MAFRPEAVIIDSIMIKPMQGGIARTPSGTTSFEYRPGKAGGTVVFIHGFAIPSTVWNRNFHHVSERGHPALRFDRFGLGCSASAEKGAPHTIELFVSQLKELLDEIRPPMPLSLVGLSFGAAVAARFARRYPTLVGRICFIAPAVKAAISPASRLIFMPGLGSLLFKVLGRTMLGTNLRKAIPPAQESAFIKECLKQLDAPGYLKALESTVKHAILPSGSIDYGELPENLPLSLIWGTEDAVIPFRHADDLRRRLGKCEFHPLHGAGHCAPIERAEEVNGILDDFLKSGRMSR